jgi:hypothetical protein
MAIERSPSWVKDRVILPPTGPKAVGNRPAATAPPSRPVTRETDDDEGKDSTNTRTIPRPAQGNNSVRDNTLV